MFPMGWIRRVVAVAMFGSVLACGQEDDAVSQMSEKLDSKSKAESEEQESGYEAARLRMVRSQLAAAGRDIEDPRVLAAMKKVPRHEFVPERMRRFAYSDSPLSIGHGQTISQPYIVAFMTEQLKPTPTDRVLEIGTGSGYQAAVLGELVKEVYSIEIVEPLAKQAKATLENQGYKNVHVRAGDGYKGWPEEAPFRCHHRHLRSPRTSPKHWSNNSRREAG